ncbi:hypothetical protein HNP38_002946 [Chryseobacterium defluvii]|uniref:WG repeat protein n=1 Tax=Chryseobacterium defluvii TaxID=160396 RepID=A0A840KJF7_9FLAO|nr:hypothetical protein [Chryseobacterium defluvii]MBB4807640.1 hypothetical protein [Chryseobacterium defluvii]
MKKGVLLILMLFLFLGKAQEKKYMLLQNGDLIIYKDKGDGSFAMNNYVFRYGKLETNSNVFKPSNQKEIDDFYNMVIPLQNVKSDPVTAFNGFKNKVFTVKNKNAEHESRYVFYGNQLYSSTDFSGYTEEFPLMLYNGWKSEQEEPVKYLIHEIEGITFFAVDNKIFPFQLKTFFNDVFPDCEVKPSKVNFANPQFYGTLKIESKSIQKGDNYLDFYGVNDNLGNNILPVKYQKIIITTDAILAKENGYWYFYDFYGYKIMKTGYRKILPLKIEDQNYESNPKIETKGMLQYAVLEKNEPKILGRIYENNENSEFISLWRVYDVCGTKMGSWSTTQSQIRLKDNDVSIWTKTDLYNSRLMAIESLNDHVVFENKQISHIGEHIGVIGYLNKIDSTQSFGKIGDGFVYFVKTKINNKEGLLGLKLSCYGQECSKYIVSQENFVNSNNDKSTIPQFDKIEDVMSDLPLLTFQGNDYQDYFYFPLETDNANNNLYPHIYYKITDNGKMALYSPRLQYLMYVTPKYKRLDDLKNRFSRFEDEKGKSGWLSEDGEEFYDL